MTRIPAPKRVIKIEHMTQPAINKRDLMMQASYELMNLVAGVTLIAGVIAVCAMIKFN